MSFLKKFLGFVESYPGVLGDIDGFVQLIPGSYKSDKFNNTTGSDKIYLKCDCIQGSIVNGSRNLFYTLLLLVHHQVIKYTKNQE